MEKLQGEYKVNLYNPLGTKVAVIDDWRSLQIKHLINDPGYCNLILHGGDPIVDLFEDNGIVEVLRKVPGKSPGAVPSVKQRDGEWYVEYEGLHVDTTEITLESGDEQFVSHSKGYLDLAGRRYIMWPATVAASESKKVGVPAQTAIYEYVNENCGPAALSVSGRFVDGVISGLSVPAWTGNGDLWYGQRAYRNLLETIQAIADFAQIDFDIVGLGGASWQFETYIDQLGEDRTTTGLDDSGKNSSGNSPVIFSIELGNVSKVVYKKQNSNTANFVVTAGQGQYTARMIGTATNASEIDAARVNQREISRNANTQSSQNELDTLASEYLEKFQATEDFTITPLLSRSTIYGVDYWWGDKVTARYKGLERNKRLLGVTITVDQKGERFQGWNFWTI